MFYLFCVWLMTNNKLLLFLEFTIRFITKWMFHKCCISYTKSFISMLSQKSKTCFYICLFVTYFYIKTRPFLQLFLIYYSSVYTENVAIKDYTVCLVIELITKLFVKSFKIAKMRAILLLF